MSERREGALMGLRALSGDLVFYGALDLAQRSISLLLVPLYTRMLSQQDFGNLDILLVVLSVLTVIVDLQFVAGFSRLYFDYKRREEGGQFAGTLLVVRLVAGTALAAAIPLAGRAGFLDTRFAPTYASHHVAWLLLAATVPLSLSYDLLLLQSRMLRRKKAFAAGALSSVLASGVASLLLVAVLHWGVSGVLTGLLVGRAVGAAFLAVGLRDEIRLGIHPGVLRPVFAYAAPLIPGWWLGFSSSYVGRFFVFGARGPEENALLAIAMKVAGVIGLFSISFRSAWLPLAMSYIGEDGGEIFYVRSLRLFLAGCFATAAVLGASLGVLLPVLAPESYSGVEYYFPLFAVGTLLAECESSLQLGNQISKRTGWISVSAFIYLAVNLIVLTTLTSRLGILAAGIGLMLAAGSKATFTYFTSQANHRIPYDRKALVVFVGGCAAFVSLGLAMSTPTVPAGILRAGMLALGVIVPFLILQDAERQALRQVVLARLRGWVLTAQGRPKSL